MEEAILIRTDADHSTGYGHLMRCLSLAAEMKRHGQRAAFVMSRADASARELIRQHGHDARFTSAGDDLMAEARELPRARFPARAIMLDFSHQHVLAQAARMPDYVDAIRGVYSNVMMMDGLGDDSIAGRVSRLDVDLLIAPYVGADRAGSVPTGVRSRLAGPQFFVFSPDFQSLTGKRRRVRKTADRILITFGGTDPHRITLKAIQAVDSVRGRKLRVRVIVGPGFEGSLAGQIAGAAAAGEHAFEVVTAPKNLAGHMVWCDLAISGTGLTKYELALTGTPSIQLSIDEAHARVNEDFVRTGASVHLGVHSDVSTARVTAEIRGILDNADSRREMSRCGHALTDGLGAERIVREIMQVTYAS